MKGFGLFVLGVVFGVVVTKAYERLLEQSHDGESLASEIESRLDALEVGV